MCANINYVSCFRSVKCDVQVRLLLENEATLCLVTFGINLCSWGLHRIKDIGEGREGENFAFIAVEEGVGK